MANRSQEPKPELGLEAAMDRLETLVDEMESGEFTLEQNLTKFEEGIKLGNKCKKLLETAELRVRRLVESDGEIVEEDDDTR